MFFLSNLKETFPSVRIKFPLKPCWGRNFKKRNIWQQLHNFLQKLFSKKVQCFWMLMKETPLFVRIKFLEECFHNWSPCFHKNKYSHKEHKFFETKNKETFIHKAENSPGQCWSKSLLWFWLIWKLSGSKVSAKIDRTSFSMVLTIFLPPKCLPKLIALHLAWC